MGKDFRVGLMTGVVLAGAALIWVATRPSLGPRARVGASPQSSAPAPKAGQTQAGANPESPALPWENAEVAEANGPGRDESSVARTLPVPSTPLSPHPNSALAAAGGAQPIVRANQDSPLPPDLTIYETSEPIKTTRFHIVRKGETLSSIAGQYYGSSDKWRKILAANQKSIKNPNKIVPGTKLTIPE